MPVYPAIQGEGVMMQWSLRSLGLSPNLEPVLGTDKNPCPQPPASVSRDPGPGEAQAAQSRHQRGQAGRGAQAPGVWGMGRDGVEGSQHWCHLP